MSRPIQNVDSIDVVGIRNDAGIDLCVSCSGPLDDSCETLSSLQIKVRGYIEAASSPNIWQAYPTAKVGPVDVYISCAYAVSAAALKSIDLLIDEAAQKGVTLRLVKSVS
jgi:hypothetical protein